MTHTLPSSSQGNPSPQPRFRPRLDVLEERLPPGDVLIGTMFGSSWLGLSLVGAGQGPSAWESQPAEQAAIRWLPGEQLEPALTLDKPTATPVGFSATPSLDSGTDHEALGSRVAGSVEVASTAPSGPWEREPWPSGASLTAVPPGAGHFAGAGDVLAVGSASDAGPVSGGPGSRVPINAVPLPMAASGSSNPTLVAPLTRPGHLLGQGRLVRGKGDAISDVLPVQGANAALRPPSAGLGVSHPTDPPIHPLDAYQWNTSFTGANWVFEDVSFGDPDNGFAVAEQGKVLRTQDGGATWNTVMNVGFPYYWYGVQALDAQRVVIAGFNNQTGDGVLRWTYDGGNTWSDDLIPTGNPGFIRWLDKIGFVDDTHGLAFASWTGGDHATATGGQTADDWTYAQADPSQSWFQGNFTYWPDGSAWVAGINFCHSADHGLSWQCQPSIDPVFDGGGVSFPDASHGWVAGGEILPQVKGWVHRTTDGGQTWSDRILNTPFPIRSILFLNDQVGFAAGGSYSSGVGGIYSTMDGGDTWELDIDAGAEIRSLKAVWTAPDTANVWAVGFGPGLTGQILTTQVDLSAGMR